ncbi:MAG: Tim44 domain-containing protein, partial [Acinetobacter sp.]|nr:Tim44 domain-containing protein [Acinetobacter sp.]
MKKNHWLAILLATTVVFSPIAEAKRAGGGKSQGMTRNVQQTRPATPAVPATPAPAQKKSNVGGMVAAGVVGAAAGALAANALADDDSTQQQENSSWGWLFWVALA